MVIYAARFEAQLKGKPLATGTQLEWVAMFFFSRLPMNCVPQIVLGMDSVWRGPWGS